MKAVALLAAIAIVSAAASARRQEPQTTRPADRCGWTAPQSARTVTVKTTAQLVQAVANAQPDTTILLADGDYRLERSLNIAVPGLVLRGNSGDRSKVVIRGADMTEQQVGVALSVSAPQTTIADLTVGYVGFHGIQVRGESGASNTTVHNVRVVDTGQQLLKGSTSGNGRYASHCTVACSLFEYTDHAPSDYTNGVDVLAGKSWIVRDSEFRRIRGPREKNWSAGPAILFWGQSEDTLVERNLVVDSFRGIALGLTPRRSRANAGPSLFDHERGVIRHNIVRNPAPWADEGIEANDAHDVSIDDNTVAVDGQLGWSISLRFGGTTGWARNNVTNKRIVFRDGGQAILQGNVRAAQ